MADIQIKTCIRHFDVFVIYLCTTDFLQLQLLADVSSAAEGKTRGGELEGGISGRSQSHTT